MFTAQRARLLSKFASQNLNQLYVPDVRIDLMILTFLLLFFTELFFEDDQPLEEFLPFFIISLVEHKSKVDYNVVMQIFRYMSFTWEDYEREIEKKDELSVVMMLDKLRDATEFARLRTGMEAGYLGEVLSGSPEYLLGIIARMAEVLLSRLNVPSEEAAAFTNQIKEKRMGELFSNFKGYDVQATRRQAYQEGERKGKIKKLIGQIRKKRQRIRPLRRLLKCWRRIWALSEESMI